jgi:CheY-like chemotaxis protein
VARILLIDDDEEFRKMLHKSLVRAGHEVQDAANGKQGLALFKQRSTDVVVTDLIMPDMEGLETIIALRHFDPPAKIIAMSGGGRVNAQDYLASARQLGANRILAKPFSLDELTNAIAGILLSGE